MTNPESNQASKLNKPLPKWLTAVVIIVVALIAIYAVGKVWQKGITESSAPSQKVINDVRKSNQEFDERQNEKKVDQAIEEADVDEATKKIMRDQINQERADKELEKIKNQ